MRRMLYQDTYRHWSKAAISQTKMPAKPEAKKVRNSLFFPSVFRGRAAKFTP
jgi:hypothetical protein